MEIIKIFVMLASTVGYFLLIYKKCNILGWFAPVLTFCGISLCLYAGGLAGALEITASGVLLGGLLCLIYMVFFIVKKKMVFTGLELSAGCMVTGGLLVLFVVSGQKLIHYDNFSHWALIVKYLLVTGEYPDASDQLIMFKDYPPGTAVFLYYACKFLGKTERVMLIAQTVLILAAFAALFGVVREKRRFLLYAFLAMGCSLLSYLNLSIRINNLLVDFLLPVLTLASVVIIFRCQHRPEKMSLCTAVILGYIGIIKGTGPVFAGLGFLFFLRTMWRNKTCRKSRRLSYMLLTGVISMLPYLLWEYHVDTILGETERKFGFSAVTVEYRAAGEEFYGQIIRDFIQEGTDLTGRAIQVFLLSNLLAAAVVWYVRVYLHKRWKLGRTLILADVVTGVYYAGLLGLYLYSMPEEEAVRLAGFERYTCSIMVLFAGMLILQTTVDIERSFAVGIDERGGYRAYSSPEAKIRYQYAVLACMAVAVNFLYSEINGLRSIRKDYDASLPAKVKRITGDCWDTEGGIDEKKYLVAASDQGGQVEDWSVWYVCRYFLFAPDVTVIQDLGQEDIWEYDCIIILDEEAAGAEPGIYTVDPEENVVDKEETVRNNQI